MSEGKGKVIADSSLSLGGLVSALSAWTAFVLSPPLLATPFALWSTF
jgi:hypothetical protein